MFVCNSASALKLSHGIYLEKADTRGLLVFLLFCIILTVKGSLSFQLKWNLGLISTFLEGTVVNKYSINTNVFNTFNLQIQTEEQHKEFL